MSMSEGSGCKTGWERERDGPQVLKLVGHLFVSMIVRKSKSFSTAGFEPREGACYHSLKALSYLNDVKRPPKPYCFLPLLLLLLAGLHWVGSEALVACSSLSLSVVSLKSDVFVAAGFSKPRCSRTNFS